MLLRKQSTFYRSATPPYTLTIASPSSKKGWWVVHGLNFFLFAQVLVVGLAMSSPKTLASLPTWPWLTKTVTTLNKGIVPDNPAIVTQTINQPIENAPVESFLRSPAPTPATAKAATPRPQQYISTTRQSLRFGLIMPIAFEGITQNFGHGHTGIDLRANLGTPINATANGRVIEAKTSGWNGGWGKFILMDVGNGLTVRYAHLSEVYVSPGETIKQGLVIGKSGATGRATGPHLHLEVRQNGVPVNPIL